MFGFHPLVAAWHDAARAALPSFVDDDAVMVKASALLALSSVSDADGSATAVDGIVSDAEGLARWARLADMRHGDVSTERAWHAYVREVTPSYRADGSPVDTVPAHPAAPAAIDGSRHTVRRGRSKRGATAVVTARGVATVIGSWEHDASGGLTPERLSILAEVMGVRYGVNGANVIDVQRVTAMRYERSGLVPALDGSDAEVWSEMTPATIGVRTAPDGEVWASADVVDVARQNVRDIYAAAGLGHLTSDIRDGARCDVQTFTPELQAWPTRRRLTVPRKRKLDVMARRVTLANGYCLTAISELLAPAADSAHVWRGHALVARPAASGGTTVRGKRKRTTRAKRTVGPTFDATDRATLLAHFATLTAGQRTTWTLGAMRGTFTLSPNRRYNIGVKHDRGDVTASRRTMTAVDRIIERQEWLTAQPA
jgi:hypothetical protein